MKAIDILQDSAILSNIPKTTLQSLSEMQMKQICHSLLESIENDDDDHLNDQGQTAAEGAGIFLLLQFHQFLLHFLLGRAVGASGIFLADHRFFRVQRRHFNLVFLLLDAHRNENDFEQKRKQQQ